MLQEENYLKNVPINYSNNIDDLFNIDNFLHFVDPKFNMLYKTKCINLN